MTYAAGRLGRVFVVRLRPGSDLLRSLEQLAGEAGIRAGLVLGGAASLRQAVLRNVKVFPDRFPITDLVRVLTIKKDPLELTSISGNISLKDGNPFVHCHVTVSSGEEDGRAYGGHLLEGCIIFSTGELAVAELSGVELMRVHDEETHALELVPREATV